MFAHTIDLSIITAYNLIVKKYFKILKCRLEDKNELILKENTEIENLIYEIRGKQVMLVSEIFVIKCHDNYYTDMITHYNIDKPISLCKTNKLRRY